MASGMNSKEEVLYFPAVLLNRATDEPPGATCGKCMMFLTETSECTVVDTSAAGDGSSAEVSGPNGVCGIMVPGDTMPVSETHKAMMIIPAVVVGYTEEAPTRCGNCRAFMRPHKCLKVVGQVEENGCCNAWKAHRR